MPGPGGAERLSVGSAIVRRESTGRNQRPPRAAESAIDPGGDVSDRIQIVFRPRRRYIHPLETRSVGLAQDCINGNRCRSVRCRRDFQRGSRYNQFAQKWLQNGPKMG